jgi:DNA-binding MarR family transcriptional regulator
MASSPSRAADPVCTCFMVRSLSRKISQLYDDTLAPSGLRGTQFSLLVQARNAPEGPPTVSALAEQLHTDRTTMTRNLRTLQQAGFIDLVPGADARSRCVVVTPPCGARPSSACASCAAASR